jgi:hypothetical protein
MNSAEQKDIENALEGERKNEQRSLGGIVAKMKLIAAEQYDGKIYDNIYSIFNQLLVNERRMLLKGIINILLIVENKSDNGSLTGQAYVPSPGLGEVKNTVLQVEENINSNLNTIEHFNKIEMIKLKSSVTKILIIAVVGTIAAMLIAAVTLSSSKTETIGIFAEFFKIVGEMMGVL